MTSPSVTSISFDKSSYEPGDTITATVIYTSPSQHGGEGLVGYNLSVSLTDEINADTNEGLTGQSGEFYVDSGSTAVPNPVDIAVAAGLVTTGLNVTSLTSGNSGTTEGIPNEVTSLDTASVTADAESLLILWVSASGGVSAVSGLGLTWTQEEFSGDDLSVWYAPVTATVSGEVTFTLVAPQGPAYDLDVVTGVDLDTPFASSPISATGTSYGGNIASLTFSTAANSANRFLFGVTGGTDISPAETPAWAQLASIPYGPSLETEVSPDSASLTPSANFTGSDETTWVAVGLELNAFSSGVGLPPGSWTLVFNNLASDGTGTAVFEAVASI